MASLKLHKDVVWRLYHLKPNELLRGCDGKTCYTATREGEHVVIQIE